MAVDDRKHPIIEYMYKKLAELKEIVGPLENLDAVSKNGLELIFDAPQFRVKEIYEGNITISRSYNLEYDNEFYRSYIILHLTHEILDSRHGKTEWDRFKNDTIIQSLLTEFNIWENSGPINDFMKEIVNSYHTFETNEATREYIKSTYALKGHIDISLLGYSPEDFE